MNVHSFYPTKPAISAIVVGVIKSIGDVAAYCTLRLHGNIEYMLPLTEINMKRHKRVSDYIRVGQDVVLQIMGTDTDTYVSMKEVSENEKKTAMERYVHDLKVDLIVRTAAEQNPDRIAELLKTVVHPLLEKDQDPYLAFEEVRIAKEDGAAIPDIYTPALVTAIQQKMPVVTHTAEKEIVMRFGCVTNGVDRLNQELNRIAAIPGIRVFIVAPPKYKLVATDRTPTRAAALLDSVAVPTPS